MKERPEAIFRNHGGQLRMSEAIKHGITRYMLFSLRDKGIIERVSRGIYRLVELLPISKSHGNIPASVRQRLLNRARSDQRLGKLWKRPSNGIPGMQQGHPRGDGPVKWKAWYQMSLGVFELL